MECSGKLLKKETLKNNFAQALYTGMARDKRAVEWYRRAAEQGLLEAQYNLGNMYADGRGVEKDEVCAVDWYWKAAEQGSVEAQKSRFVDCVIWHSIFFENNAQAVLFTISKENRVV